MPKVGVRRTLSDVRIADAEALWFDISRWTGFVDGFGHIERTDGDWPEAGSRVVWESRPGGRGRVVERSSGVRRGEGQTSTIDDTDVEGTQTVSFDQLDEGVVMTIELEYTRKTGGPLSQMADMLFVRSAMKSSIKRTMARFDRELSAERELTTK